MKISIITPSLNQGDYIERTIRSVTTQEGDFELEYLVVDGGSRDNTLDILRSYESKLIWTSEPDEGQSDAVNKGFNMATGDILAWLNSDDTYLSNTLNRVISEYHKIPFAWCFGNCRIINTRDEEIRHAITRYKIRQSGRYSYPRLLRRDFIPQPAVFFTKQAYQETGELDRRLKYSMDYDYWLRLGKRYTPRYMNHDLANFRWHEKSKNGRHYEKAAWETYLTATRYASHKRSFDIFMHYAHYHALKILYRFI